MPDPSALDPKHTAVLIMDYQAGIVAMLPEAESLCERAASVLAAARAAAFSVIHVVVQFRPGYPEIDPRNLPLVERIQRSGRLLAGSPEAQEVPAIAPRDRDIVVVKHRVGAFSGTELDALLRALHVDTLILLGVSTSGVILSTVRQAFDSDYRAIVVGDCCADPDPALHAVLMEKVLSRQAQLTSTAEILPQLRAAGN